MFSEGNVHARKVVNQELDSTSTLCTSTYPEAGTRFSFFLRLKDSILEVCHDAIEVNIAK